MSKSQNQQLRCPKSGRFITKKPEAPTAELAGKLDQINPTSTTTETHKQFKSEVSDSVVESAKDFFETHCIEPSLEEKVELL